MTTRLSLRNITKRYPGIVANDGVTLDIAPGEVLAILGENGAGKSTLMKIIYGAVRPDEGEISFDGKPLAVESPAQARELGIAMVHQHFALFDTLTVTENVALGLTGNLSPSQIENEIRSLGERYGLEVDPKAVVMELSMGERQRVEILRALMTHPKLLILDEPTSVLTPQAVRKLFTTLHKLADEGVSILFISHKLDEIRELADRCVVLRAGRAVASVDPKAETEDALARLMIGNDPPKVSESSGRTGDVIFEMNNVTVPGTTRVCGISDVNVSVRAGEIVGIAGISGNGQSIFMGAAAGERPTEPDHVKLFGRPVGDLDTYGRRLSGLRYVPEQRLGHAAVPELSLTANNFLTSDSLVRGGFIMRAKAKTFANKIIERFHVKTTGPEKAAGSLSGGNLQKFIMGREILNRPRVLLVHQPTWGVDVGAAAVIRNSLIRLRDDGAAIIVVSEEIDELFEISDRIGVMYRGALSPVVPKNTLTVEEVGRWMSGLWPDSPFSKNNAEA
ncbi:ABC transporter ATP-binding protein [Sutterella sp.]|uniref:ABC transporter ATP-binding protein n=1 Tax=Sutterella sp. TaxID=1981025 RepID=UPI0026E07897|nr:ABC transporter ATP-binding protein [Sutterella sp.]MDO5532042.1 ABC transporter ATP-binding protein [Sutterella sp.]